MLELNPQGENHLIHREWGKNECMTFGVALKCGVVLLMHKRERKHRERKREREREKREREREKREREREGEGKEEKASNPSLITKLHHYNFDVAIFFTSSLQEEREREIIIFYLLFGGGSRSK